MSTPCDWRGSKVAHVTRLTGIRKIHSKACPAKADSAARCKCRPSWEASVYDATAKRKIRRNFSTESAAKAWRNASAENLRRGELRAAPPTTIRQAAATLLDGMRSGVVRNRSGDLYKPSVIRSYDQALKLYILPEVG